MDTMSGISGDPSPSLPFELQRIIDKGGTVTKTEWEDLTGGRAC